MANSSHTRRSARASGLAPEPDIRTPFPSRRLFTHAGASGLARAGSTQSGNLLTREDQCLAGHVGFQFGFLQPLFHDVADADHSAKPVVVDHRHMAATALCHD